jgi:ElaB/YqjD/DUF883 family membrane-anchored ribosome-binding protein
VTHEHDHSSASEFTKPPDELELLAAQEDVRLAREKLEKAEQHFKEIRRRANEAEGAGHIATIGEVIDDVYSLIKKYPLPSLGVALSVGFFLGRLFRR